MPYTDKEQQAAAQRRYRRKDLRRARAAERKRKQAQRRQSKHRRIEELDERPTACFFRFFTTNACRKKAKWLSATGARWCDEHESLADYRADLVPLS